jgi:hypothetical protein
VVCWMRGSFSCSGSFGDVGIVDLVWFGLILMSVSGAVGGFDVCGPPWCDEGSSSFALNERIELRQVLVVVLILASLRSFNFRRFVVHEASIRRYSKDFFRLQCADGCLPCW